MGILGRIFGTAPSPKAHSASAVDRAVERYRQLLRSASPAAVEEAHRAAFAQLTEEQRVEVLRALSQELDEAPPDASASADPTTLARVARRMEEREPGSTERALCRTAAPGAALGGLIGAVALGFVGPAVVHGVFADDGFDDLGDYD